jgi:predicted CxxxxCH...CXXCH cytochrome family protein
MIVMLLLVGLFLFGCGSESENKDNPRNPDSDTHVAGWFPSGHAAKADPVLCAECHGDDLRGGISGISCYYCHTNGSPFVLTQCTSCHTIPPSGTVAPNRAGAHATHLALLNPANVCDTCHKGAGSGTPKHDNGIADGSILSVYSAKSGTAVNNADGTCSKVSCHGGQKTPDWLTTIDVSTQCELCHAYGSLEYNSYVSGQHDFHVNIEDIPCISCHDSVKLSLNHFTSLNTTTMEGSASATIGKLVTNYASGTCTTVCHVPRSW